MPIRLDDVLNYEVHPNNYFNVKLLFSENKSINYGCTSCTLPEVNHTPLIVPKYHLDINFRGAPYTNKTPLTTNFIDNVNKDISSSLEDAFGFMYNEYGKPTKARSKKLYAVDGHVELENSRGRVSKKYYFKNLILTSINYGEVNRESSGVLRVSAVFIYDAFKITNH